MKQSDADHCDAPNTIHPVGLERDLQQKGNGVRITMD